ncbi:MAG: hypothetical protein Q9225_001963 [Loekoesia sp. 1 TL-2023]
MRFQVCQTTLNKVITSDEIKDAQFEVTDSAFPLLNVSLSASQNLYTRRGTLVGLGGKAENHGQVKQFPSDPRSAPRWYGSSACGTNFKADMVKSLAHWGSSQITGRGLLALAGRGSIVQISLESGESYIAHPSNIVAYSMNRQNPLPYRLKSSIFRIQIPDLKLSGLIPDAKFFQVVRGSSTWKVLARFFRTIRTWLRRSIWGDRLFLEFHGPSTILLQTRAARLNDVLTSRDVNEIAEAPAGSVRDNLRAEANMDTAAVSQQLRASQAITTKPAQMSTAIIGPDGKVIFTKEGAGS